MLRHLRHTRKAPGLKAPAQTGYFGCGKIKRMRIPVQVQMNYNAAQFRKETTGLAHPTSLHIRDRKVTGNSAIVKHSFVKAVFPLRLSFPLPNGHLHGKVSNRRSPMTRRTEQQKDIPSRTHHWLRNISRRRQRRRGKWLKLHQTLAASKIAG